MILAMVNLKKIWSYLKDIEYAGMDTRIASKQPIKVESGGVLLVPIFRKRARAIV